MFQGPYKGEKKKKEYTPESCMWAAKTKYLLCSSLQKFADHSCKQDVQSWESYLRLEEVDEGGSEDRPSHLKGGQG